MVQTMRDEFEPETIRLILGELISADEFFPDEKAMILNTPKTLLGIQRLIDYLKSNVNCLYGWDIYFEQYYDYSTNEQKLLVNQILESTFEMSFLCIRFPQVY